MGIVRGPSKWRLMNKGMHVTFIREEGYLFDCLGYYSIDRCGNREGSICCIYFSILVEATNYCVFVMETGYRNQ